MGLLESVGFLLLLLSLPLKNTLIINDNRPTQTKKKERTRIQAFHKPNSKAGMSDMISLLMVASTLIYSLPSTTSNVSAESLSKLPQLIKNEAADRVKGMI